MAYDGCTGGIGNGAALGVEGAGAGEPSSYWMRGDEGEGSGSKGCCEKPDGVPYRNSRTPRSWERRPFRLRVGQGANRVVRPGIGVRDDRVPIPVIRPLRVDRNWGLQPSGVTLTIITLLERVMIRTTLLT